MNTEQIIQEFNSNYGKYYQFAEQLNILLKSLLEKYDINVHQLCFRIKDKDSLENKLIKKINTMILIKLLILLELELSLISKMILIRYQTF